jgi:rubrerythrin
VFVTTREGVERLSVGHARAGGSFGSGELVWRCLECGEMDHIEDGLPEACPNCSAPKEDLMYWTED